MIGMSKQKFNALQFPICKKFDKNVFVVRRNYSKQIKITSNIIQSYKLICQINVVGLIVVKSAERCLYNIKYKKLSHLKKHTSLTFIYTKNNLNKYMCMVKYITSRLLYSLK